MKKGFTLIETLVAIAIMMIAIVGPLTIAHKGVQSALYAKDQVTAYYLAQDAVEYIRAVRDSNVLAHPDGSTWLDGLNSPGTSCISPYTCSVDTTSSPLHPSVTACPSSTTCPVLMYDPSSGNYGNSGSVNSGFTRSVSIDTAVPNNAMVKVTISWNTGLFIQTFAVQENLMNIFAQ